MQVEIRHAPASVDRGGQQIYFCSEHCQDRFVEDPQRHLATVTASDASAATATDPVCGMTVERSRAAAHRRHAGQDYWFCSPGCAETFDAHPRGVTGHAHSPSPVPFSSRPHHQ
jgi:Cu+-exporting ATPase